MNKTTIPQYFRSIIEGLITSVSGWRKIFIPNTNSYIQDNQCVQFDVSPDDYTLVYYATTAYLKVMIKYFRKKHSIGSNNYAITLARDTRSTGASIISAVTQACEDYGDENGSRIKVIHLGIVCIPQVMTYTEFYTSGFIYCTASHNPIEYNGLKFGGSHGQVITKDKAEEVLDMFYSQNIVSPIIKKNVDITCEKEELHKSFVSYEDRVLAAVFRQYNKTALMVSKVGNDKNLYEVVRNKIKLLEQKPGIILDPNGGARCGEFDAEIFYKFGIPVQVINNTHGIFGHAILPEGRSLMQVRQLLSKLIKVGLEGDENYCLATVCDCDGDRGNMVLLSGRLDVRTQMGVETRVLMAQEVFALTLAIELAWQRIITPLAKIAVVVNGPTSLRCNIIAKYYDCKLFKVEVGEANIVDKAHKLMKDGYIVPIVGEGSNGGCVILPSSGRDPLCSTLSFLKLLILGGSLYKGKHTGISAVHELLAILPTAVTTEIDDSDAKFIIPSNIKFPEFIRKVFVEFEKCYSRFERVFADNGKKVFSIKVCNFSGEKARKVDLKNIEIYDGGVAIEFFGEHKNMVSDEELPLGFVWIRPSGTEPVVRIVADVIGKNALTTERALITLWRDVLERSKCS